MVTDTPASGPPSRISPVRAVVVIAVFVAAAVLLVAIGTRPPTNGEAAPPVATTTTTTTTAPASTTTTTEAPGTVSVLVANATQQNALAAHYTAVLAAKGWAVKTPADAATTVATSAVYYAAGHQGSAETVAGQLGIAAADVLPLTTAVPVPGATGNDVVVVIGANLVTTAS
jgi:LytR cell envelope-related transcriptional attenuator